MAVRYNAAMSYTITLWCGCSVSVIEGGANQSRTRILERRGESCPDTRHIVAARLRLWEMLPDLRPRHYEFDHGGDAA